jgi:hypothetical protein
MLGMSQERCIIWSRGNPIARIEDVLEAGDDVVTGLAIGATAFVVWPVIRPLVRPLAKAAIKGGIMAYREATKLY